MSLKDTIKKMNTSLADLVADLEKAERGNKTASQRVRTGSIHFAKLAKLYRKESVKSEKESKGKPKVPKKKATSKKVARKKTVTPKKAVAKKKPVKKAKKK